MLTEALRRRRVEAAAADRFVERLFGLELTQATYDRGSAFVRGVLEREGEDGLRRLWEGDEQLPTPAEVDAPGLWLARISPLALRRRSPAASSSERAVRLGALILVGDRRSRITSRARGVASAPPSRSPLVASSGSRCGRSASGR